MAKVFMIYQIQYVMSGPIGGGGGHVASSWSSGKAYLVSMHLGTNLHPKLVGGLRGLLVTLMAIINFQ
jgi:hypothetical protein